MPKQEFVVKLNEQTDLFLVYYSTDPAHCQWGAIHDAIKFSTIEEANVVANAIGGGSLGVPR
jgi:hypothetical protein